jgi:predicted TIM-barrel fold metal-dependent hydrolase
MELEIRPEDAEYYHERLGFLPPRIIDIHTHVWLLSARRPSEVGPRGPTWPGRVAAENPIEDHLASYRLLLPGQAVTPVIFGPATRAYDLEESNRYVSQVAARQHLPCLLVTSPEWTALDLELQVVEGGFLGLKPYLEFAPPHIPSDDIAIFDFLPYHHLELADARGWIVMLHIPRRARLRDPLNLRQLAEIDSRFPGVRLVIAHLGRAYCPQDVGDAFAVLKDTRACFDFSANTNAWAMERALRSVGPKRMLFGSDQPVVRMRMRRICEDGFYVNLVPPGLYGDVRDDPHMREVSVEEGSRLSFFLYEELSAFGQAADAVGLTKDDIADIMYHNAARLIAEAGGSVP